MTKGQLMQLAAIPALFVGGYLAQYGIQNGLGLGLNLAMLGITRKSEEEADQLGTQYLWNAGYDPEGFITFFQKLQAREDEAPGKFASFWRTHPPVESRIEKVREEISYLPPKEEYVLSVQGREDLDRNYYDDYFASGQGFGGTQARDRRPQTKAPIYAVHWEGIPYVFPHASVGGGKTFEVKGQHFLLYRRAGAEVLESTLAFRSSAGFEKRDGRWYEKGTGAVLNAQTGRFEGSAEPLPLTGFDTFWYTCAEPATANRKSVSSHQECGI